MRRVTVADIALPGSNSFGLVRLMAALAVIVSHGYVVTQGMHAIEPLELLTGYPLGAHAVHVFFTVSGMLVAASYERSPGLARFALARILRIFPALLFVSLGVFLFSAFFLSSATPFDIFATAGNGFFAKILIGLSGSGEVAGVFLNTPVPNGVNVPLWTLKYEVLCYISLALLMWLPHHVSGLKPIWLSISVVTVSGAWMLRGIAYDDAHLLDHVARFSFAFWIGVLAWQLRDKIPVKAPPLLALFCLSSASIALGLPVTLHLIVLLSGYAALFAGRFHYGALTAFTDRNDLSYGSYIMAWPVQQALVQTFPSISPMGNALATMLVVLPLAFISWQKVEKPALRLKDKYAALLPDIMHRSWL
jgi:peptidoglycan/LPS O-acetylase OafA/YrhL